MKNYIIISIKKYPTLKKCECCNRVKDIYFIASIMDFEETEKIVGDLDLCKECGSNLNKILGNERPLGEKIIKEFTFGG